MLRTKKTTTEPVPRQHKINDRVRSVVVQFIVLLTFTQFREIEFPEPGLRVLFSGISLPSPRAQCFSNRTHADRTK